MIHYHGTPINPKSECAAMAGRNFCIPFTDPRQLKLCLQIGQCLMFDNGAFSAYTLSVPFNEEGFYKWIEPVLAHPHWAVVPDVIDGSEDEQRALVKRWPFRRELGLPVWHLGLSIDYLLELADQWPRLCFGSSGQFWQVGSPAWCERMDLAFNALARRGPLPWVHGLRMLGMTGERWPLASADSTNVAKNWKRDGCCAERKASAIDAVQTPLQWQEMPTQGFLCLSH